MSEKKQKNTSLARRGEHQLSSSKDGFEFDFGYSMMEQTMKMCTSIAQSGMVPREYANAPKKVLVASAMGARFKLDPLQSLQSIAVVNGTPTFYGDAVLGICRNSGKEDWTLEGVRAMEYVAEKSKIYKKWLEHYDYKPSKIAFCVTMRKGNDEPTIQHYTIDQAREAGLLNKDNWKKNPVRMLQMRARSFALRDEYPDVLQGYKTYEEMRDVDELDGRQKPDPLPESAGEFVETEEWNDITGDQKEEEEIDQDFEVVDEEEVEEESDNDEAEQDPDLREEEEEEAAEDGLVSSDMQAVDAVDEINRMESIEELDAFFDPGDSRVTVQDAYKKMFEELSRKKTLDVPDEPNESDTDNRPPEPSQASFGDFDDFDNDDNDNETGEVDPI